MEALAEFLQKNPYIIIGLFIAAIIGLVASWQPFMSIMKRQVKVPGWVILSLILIWALTFFKKAEKPSELPQKEITKEIVGVNFGTQAVDMASKSFYRCRFINSQIVISGKGKTKLDECGFVRCNYIFVGPARVTLQFISKLYAYPETRPGIDKLLEGIKSGNVPMDNLPAEVD